MKRLLILYMFATILAGCKGHKAVPSEEIQRIEETIRASIGWAGKKDLNLLYSVIVNDSTFLEVNPGTRIIKGFDEFRKAEKIWMSPDFQAVRYEIRDLNISLSRSGDVAWWFCMLDDINMWRGEPASWINTRWTGVLEKDNGKWLIRQMHFSFATK